MSTIGYFEFNATFQGFTGHLSVGALSEIIIRPVGQQPNPLDLAYVVETGGREIGYGRLLPGQNLFADLLVVLIVPGDEEDPSRVARAQLAPSDLKGGLTLIEVDLLAWPS